MKIPAAYVIESENNNKKDMWQEEHFIQLPIPEYEHIKQELTQSIEPPSTVIVIDL